MRRFIIAAVSALSFLASAGVAAAAETTKPPAQPSQKEAAAAQAASGSELGPEGVWTSQCDIDRMTDAKTCRMITYRLVDDGPGREPGYIALSIIPTGNDYHLFLTTSQGLVQSCGIRVDRQPRIETYVATLNMCMFPNFLSGRVLDQFRNGSSVLVRVNFVRAGRRDIDFSLGGFGKNFEEMQRGLQ